MWVRVGYEYFIVAHELKISDLGSIIFPLSQFFFIVTQCVSRKLKVRWRHVPHVRVMRCVQDASLGRVRVVRVVASSIWSSHPMGQRHHDRCIRSLHGHILIDRSNALRRHLRVADAAYASYVLRHWTGRHFDVVGCSHLCRSVCVDPLDACAGSVRKGPPCNRCHVGVVALNRDTRP